MVTFTDEMDKMYEKVEPYLVMNTVTFEYELRKDAPVEIIEIHIRLQKMFKEQEECEKRLLFG